MKIDKILTKRFYSHDHCYHLVWEWEDVFKDKLDAEFCMDWNCSSLFARNSFLRACGKFYNCLPLATGKPALLIEMDPIGRITTQNNKANIIPWIVDFYYHSDAELQKFYKQYDKHRLVLISSRAVFDFLQEVHCPLPIAHLPLSISDKYLKDMGNWQNKEFDVLMAGRQNPLLMNFLERYSKTHPDLSVISCKKENGHFNYYNQKGQYFGNADTRAGLLDLMRKSRVGLYSSKGMDCDYCRVADARFSQVTPRLLEYLVTGNHVISRYEDNSDSHYFGLPDMFPFVDSYASFEQEMDKALHSDFDSSRYRQYVAKHCTSTRVEMFSNLIKGL